MCKHCKKPSDTYDSFLDLSLDVNAGRDKTVEAMLQGFIREDKLEGANKYSCEKWVGYFISEESR
jgi:ubiquitin carboxyl-terminal hydrolase 36/42